MKKIVVAIMAIMAMLGVAMVTAPAANAAIPSKASAFVVPSHITWPISNTWNPAQTTITVSDRTPNKDFRVSQSAYAWGSLAADGFQTAYTTLTSCTGCIIVVVKPKGDPYLGGAPAAASRTVVTDPQTHQLYTKACTVAIESQYWATHTDWRERQRMVTHEMGHCLGFGHANSTYNTCDLSIEANVGCPAGSRYTPSTYDYEELPHTYPKLG